ALERQTVRNAPKYAEDSVGQSARVGRALRDGRPTRRASMCSGGPPSQGLQVMVPLAPRPSSVAPTYFTGASSWLGALLSPRAGERRSKHHHRGGARRSRSRGELRRFV